MDYSIAPGWKWIADKEAAQLFKKLNLIPQYSLLLSQGSLTSFLEARSKSSVDVEIRNRTTREIGKEEAAYLEVLPVTEAVIRDVWLIQNKKRLVYARSLFPLCGLNKHLAERISASIGPLARSLTEQGLSTFKDKLEISAVECGYVNDTLNLAPETILWARRYRLLAQATPDRQSITAIASITEIFSHEIIGNQPLRRIT